MGDIFDQVGSPQPKGDIFDQVGTSTAAPPPITQDFHAAPPSGAAHPINWLTNAMGDIEQGNDSTWLGKLYKAAGGQPLQAGAGGGNPAAPVNKAPLGTPAAILGGPAVGPLQATRGALEVGSGHPIKGANDVISGVARTVAPIAAVTQPELLPIATAAVPAQMGASGVARSLGADQDTANLVGNVAAIGAGGLAAKGIAAPKPNPASARDNLIAAINPSKRAAPRVLNAVDNIPDSALQDIAQANPRTAGALQDAITAKQKALEATFQQTKAPVANQAVDLTPIGQAMLAKITPGMARVRPELVKAIQAEANKYIGQKDTIDNLDSTRSTLNDDLSAQYKKDGLTASDARKSPDYGYRFAAAEATRDLLYNEIQKATGQDLSGLKQQQSNFRKLQDAIGDAKAQSRVADAKSKATPVPVKVGNVLTNLMDLKTGTAVRQAIKGFGSKAKSTDAAVGRFSDKMNP